MSRWIALYSQTGKELANIRETLGRRPDIILTDNEIMSKVVHNQGSQYMSKYIIDQWLAANLKPTDIVTLHGYLGIIKPEAIATGARIFNGHPGLITKYPELKGRDPQEKVALNVEAYDEIGCVIHQVTSEVDGGPIIAVGKSPRPKGLRLYNDIVATLRAISEDLWIRLLVEVLNAEISESDIPRLS